MAMIKFYGYDKCSTCRKARKWLAARGVVVDEIDITVNPPPRSLLKAILKAGDYTLGELFNRSGQAYREMKIKDKLASMTQAQAVDLLASHGRLVKRPIVTDGRRYTVGFDEQRFERTWA